MQKLSKKTIAKIGSPILAGLLIAGTVFTGMPAEPVEAVSEAEQAIENEYPGVTGSGESSDKGKSETVYAVLDANGKTKEITVDEWLQNADGANTLNDFSFLKDIKNTSGNETFSQTDNDIVWNAEGNDIHYQGTYDGDLPVKMEITYRLDGKEVTAEELAGKSGDVEIRFDYHVLETATVDGYTLTHPYAIISALVLDNDHFSNIRVENGKAINDGSSTACVGFVMPGMNDNLGISDADMDIPDHVVVRAHTDDFSIEGTYSIASASLFDDMDTSKLDDTTDKLSELTDGLDELSEASSKLKEGSSKLADGAGELADGAGQLEDGTSDLPDSTKELKKGVKQLKDGTEALADGTKDLKKGTKSLAGGTSDLKDGTSSMKDGTSDLKDGTDQVNKGVNGYDVKDKDGKTVHKDGLKDGTKQLAGGASSLKEGASVLKEGASDLADGTQQLADGAGALAESLPNLVKGSGEVKNGLDQAAGGLAAITENNEALSAGGSQLSTGAGQIQSGGETVTGGGAAIKDSGEKISASRRCP